MTEIDWKTSGEIMCMSAYLAHLKCSSMKGYVVFLKSHQSLVLLVFAITCRTNNSIQDTTTHSGGNIDMIFLRNTSEYSNDQVNIFQYFLNRHHFVETLKPARYVVHGKFIKCICRIHVT